MSEDFKAFRDYKRNQHSDWYSKNMEILDKSGLEYTSPADNTRLLQLHGTTVSFYPHTGRWRYKNKTYRGGGKSFVRWYKKEQS